MDLLKRAAQKKRSFQGSLGKRYFRFSEESAGKALLRIRFKVQTPRLQISRTRVTLGFQLQLHLPGFGLFVCDVVLILFRMGRVPIVIREGRIPEAGRLNIVLMGSICRSA